MLRLSALTIGILFSYLIFDISIANSETICGIPKNRPNVLLFALYDPRAANSECIESIIPAEQVKTSKKLAEFKIKLSGDFEPGESHAIAEAFSAIAAVSSEVFSFHKNFKVHYNSDKPTSTCIGRKLILRPSIQGSEKLDSDRKSYWIAGRHIRSKGRNNSARILHELAHCYGQFLVSGKALYDSYNLYVDKKCQPTRYSSCYGKNQRRRNEEFAEAFALYFSNPDLLQKSAACRKAIEYFANLTGESKELDPLSITCQSRLKRQGTDLGRSIKKQESSNLDATP